MGPLERTMTLSGELSGAPVGWRLPGPNFPVYSPSLRFPGCCPAVVCGLKASAFPVRFIKEHPRERGRIVDYLTMGSAAQMLSPVE